VAEVLEPTVRRTLRHTFLAAKYVIILRNLLIFWLFGSRGGWGWGGVRPHLHSQEGAFGLYAADFIISHDLTHIYLIEVYVRSYLTLYVLCVYDNDMVCERVYI
jgi:hypothetical protein